MDEIVIPQQTTQPTNGNTKMSSSESEASATPPPSRQSPVQEKSHPEKDKTTHVRNITDHHRRNGNTGTTRPRHKKGRLWPEHDATRHSRTHQATIEDTIRNERLIDLLEQRRGQEKAETASPARNENPTTGANAAKKQRRRRHRSKKQKRKLDDEAHVHVNHDCTKYLINGVAHSGSDMKAAMTLCQLVHRDEKPASLGGEERFGWGD